MQASEQDSSAVDQIFDCRVIITKLIEHQGNLYHNFIDLIKALDRVWHDGLWKVLIGGKIGGGFIQVIRDRCDDPSSELF